MIVNVMYHKTVTDRIRRAMNDYYGKPGMATRQEVKQWFKTYGESMDDELITLASQIEEEDNKNE